ncbi:hypothetical protein BS78_05G156400 [Paspalum vaginatum]|nr:hypothetical protein BS78_05G156400 [Paspalum vaginatum]
MSHSHVAAVLPLRVGLHRHDRRRPLTSRAAVAGHAASAATTGTAQCSLELPTDTVMARRSDETTGTRRSTRLATAVDDVRQAQRAAVLAIGTANPANCLPQDEYADWYFRVTNSDHLAGLKAKMKKICYNSGIKTRYFHHTRDTFRDHPELVDRALPSLEARQAALASAVPELAAAAAAKALSEWGRPASDVTHLVLATYSGAHMPGGDLRLASLLGLRRSAQRTMLYLGGCAAGSAALRVARDVAENNAGARVLVACADLSLVLFRAPHEDHPGTLVMQALFGDGAGAVIVGAGACGFERPLFEIVSASQTVIPGTSAKQASRSARRRRCRLCWNDLFWAVHPGGPAILDGVEAALELEPEKLAASRRVLREYGNMSGASMIFVLDELRREELGGRSGVMLGLGPGITVETMVLRSACGHHGARAADCTR